MVPHGFLEDHVHVFETLNHIIVDLSTTSLIGLIQFFNDTPVVKCIFLGTKCNLIGIVGGSFISTCGSQ